MARTCLIITIQLSPKDLQLIRETLADVEIVQKTLINDSDISKPTYFYKLECLANDLKEMILQSKTNNFKFNGYILKLAILKTETIMSDIQLSDDTQTLAAYNTLSQCRYNLMSIFDDLINPL